MKLDEIKIGDILNYKDDRYDIIFKVTKLQHNSIRKQSIGGVVLTSCNIPELKYHFRLGRLINVQFKFAYKLTKL